MLCELTIENVAVIEKATVVFNSGFNVLTGETGAGKSILIDSINAILGNRTSKDVVRTGAEKAVIWARFSSLPGSVVTQIFEAGYTIANDEMVLFREISKDGKSVCRINGKPATASFVREVCSELINIHGQHDNQTLLNPTKHIIVLDSFAGNEVLLNKYKEAYNNYKSTVRKLKTLTMSEEEKAKKLELLRYQISEIETASLKANEETALNEQKNLIRHSEKIRSELFSANSALFGDGDASGAVSLLAMADSSIQAAKEFSEELLPISKRLNSLYYEVQEAAVEVKKAMENYEFDENSLELIEERLNWIYKLKQKYGNTIEEILQFSKDAEEEIEHITFLEDEEERLNQLKIMQANTVLALAEELSVVRKNAFSVLAEKIKSALVLLNMPSAEMTLKVEKVPANSTGQDNIEFYITTNLGDVPKPLAKIASGGELSRIMLAIKNALAEKDNVPTLIYDEVDAGIGGAAAGKVGAMLKDTSKTHQIICVTHTGQIAASAQTHLLILKEVRDGQTFTEVKSINEKGRILEIARMLQGDNITEIAINNATEMLHLAQNT